MIWIIKLFKINFHLDSMSKIYDIAILGGGLYGMTVANLLRKKLPSASICILDKKKKIDFNRKEQLFYVARTGEKLAYLKDLKISGLMKTGYEKLKSFCKSNDIEFDNIGELIVAVKSHKTRMETIFSAGQSENFKKINFDQALTYEPLLNKKNLENADIYSLSSTAIVDYNKLATVLSSEISKCEKLDLFYHHEILSVSDNKNAIDISIKNLKTDAQEKLVSNLIVNLTGSETMNFAQQLGELKNYSYLKVFAGDYYSHFPGKIKYPNTIISSVPYIVNPGLSFYVDSNENKSLGPVLKTSGKSYSFFKKLKTLNEVRKFYELLIKNKEVPENEFKDMTKMSINTFYNDIFNFHIIKFLSQEIKYYEETIVYSLKDSYLEKDIRIHKGDKGVHLINPSLQSGMSPLISISEEIVNII
jgi:L-2-hydroxyglutarate oxidase LhgO